MWPPLLLCLTALILCGCAPPRPRNMIVMPPLPPMTVTRTETQASAVIPITPTPVRLSWTFPTNRETPDMIFKVYHSFNLGVPVSQWGVLTNIPGSLRSLSLTAFYPAEWFTLTASNYLGESGYATK